MLGEIAAEIVHELRNTLQIIASSAYLAKRDPSGSEGELATIDRNARLSMAIVDDVLALARGEPPRREQVDLAEVLEAAREDLPEPGATFEDQLPSGALVHAHPGLLSRVFHVLFENAIGASAPRRPVITTRAWVEGERTLVEVEDDGPGVPTDLAPSLFEPLVSARPGGTGLGLALARRIATAHGGDLGLVPSARGATFRLDLPAGR